MRKAATLLALVFAAQAPLAVAGGFAAKAEPVLTFEAAARETAAVVPTEAIDEETVEEVVAEGTMDRYLTAALQGAPAVFDAIEAEEVDIAVPEEADEAEEAEEEPEDKGFVASATIDTTKPILQKPSGTIIKGYVAPSKYTLNATERDLVERIVMQEVSGRSYVDALAVAQTIYDRSVDWGYTVTYTVNMPYQFASPTYRYTPTATVKQAVSDVFDKGYRLTKEHMYYYYATRTANPFCFHETQRCLVETNLHRYFGPWN